MLAEVSVTLSKRDLSAIKISKNLRFSQRETQNIQKAKDVSVCKSEYRAQTHESWTKKIGLMHKFPVET